MTIDAHTHIFPAKVASRALKELSARSKIAPHSDGTAEGLAHAMAQAGIDFSISAPVATSASQTTKINDEAIRLDGKHSIIRFGTIHPDFADCENELKRLEEAGIRGIKMHPDYQNFFINDPRLPRILERAFDLKLVVLFHAGSDIGLPDPVHCTPQAAAAALAPFEGCPLVLAHMGGYSLWDDVERFLVGKDFYFDTSFGLGHMRDEQFLRIVRTHGAHRILFGSDSPWDDAQVALKKLRTVGLAPEELRLIEGANARKLLHLED